jgi:ribosomal protein S18 acetylase RimI-like enzyme
MMLSKIYVEYSFREKSVGQSILDFVEKECVLRGFSSVWLTVNKFNDDTVAWYNRRGFLVIDKVKKDIGNGFFMDDYLMEKII